MIQNKFLCETYVMHCFWNYFFLSSFCFLKIEAYNHNAILPLLLVPELLY